MKFKHKNGGICEVETADAINKLKKNSEYKELKENTIAPKTQETSPPKE